MKKIIVILLATLILVGCNNSAPIRSENVRDEFYEIGVMAIDMIDILFDAIDEGRGVEAFRDLETSWGYLIRAISGIQRTLLPYATEEEYIIYTNSSKIATYFIGGFPSTEEVFRVRNDLAILVGRRLR